MLAPNQDEGKAGAGEGHGGRTGGPSPGCCAAQAPCAQRTTTTAAAAKTTDASRRRMVTAGDAADAAGKRGERIRKFRMAEGGKER